MAVVSRTILQGFIKKGVAQGMSGNAILSSFRLQGFQIRTQTFYDDFRQIQGIAKKASTLKFTPKDKKLGRNSYTELDTFSRNRYRYVGEVRAVNNETGKEFTFNASTAGNKSIAVGDVEENILNSLERDKYGEDYTIQSVVLVEAYHRKNDTW